MASAPWQIPAVTRVVPANVAVLEFHSGLAVGLLAGIDLELAVLRGFGPQTCASLFVVICRPRTTIWCRRAHLAVSPSVGASPAGCRVSAM